MFVYVVNGNMCPVFVDSNMQLVTIYVFLSFLLAVFVSVWSRSQHSRLLFFFVCVFSSRFFLNRQWFCIDFLEIETIWIRLLALFFCCSFICYRNLFVSAADTKHKILLLFIKIRNRSTSIRAVHLSIYRLWHGTNRRFVQFITQFF